VPPTVENVTTSLARQYVAELSQAGYSPSTIGRRVATPRKQRGIPNCLSLRECQELLAATDKNHFFLLAFRDRAILGTFLYTGIRRGELLALKTSDVDVEARVLVVQNGKGGKSRVIPLCEELVELVRDWLELRPACEHQALFTTRLGQPLGKPWGARGISPSYESGWH